MYSSFFSWQHVRICRIFQSSISHKEKEGIYSKKQQFSFINSHKKTNNLLLLQWIQLQSIPLLNLQLLIWSTIRHVWHVVHSVHIISIRPIFHTVCHIINHCSHISKIWHSRKLRKSLMLPCWSELLWDGVLQLIINKHFPRIFDSRNWSKGNGRFSQSCAGFNTSCKWIDKLSCGILTG